MKLRLNESNIIWPGRPKVKPEGFILPTHLKVLTIEEKPFVYVRELTDGETKCLPEEIACPHFNTTEKDSTLLEINSI
jgi:ionotropic glutamate receptor NMDA 1